MWAVKGQKDSFDIGDPGSQLVILGDYQSSTYYTWLGWETATG
jgi:hypothetical protein